MGIVNPLKYKKSGAAAIALQELEPGDQIAAATVEALMGRNRLTNGNFDIFQERTSGTLQQQEVYCADMWNVACLGVGATCNWGIGTATFGEVSGLRNFLGFNVVAGTTAAWFGQKIERVETLSGGKATLSFYMRSNVAGKKVGVRLSQTFGTGGSAAVTTEGGVFTLGTTFQKFTVTFDVPSISGKVLGSTTDYLYLVFDVNGSGYGGQISGQTGLFEIGQAQLEGGSSATPFDFRDLGVELFMCQRHWEKSYLPGVYPGASSATAGRRSLGSGSLTGSINFYGVPIQVTKRAIGSVTVYHPTTGAAGSIGQDDNSAITTPTIQNIGTSSFELVWSNGPSRWGGFFHFTYNARIS